MADLGILKPVWEFLGLVASQIGLGAVLFVVGLKYEWWVMGSEHRALKDSCKDTKDNMDRLLSVAELNGQVADTGLRMAKR